jgi:hypothetical protein
VSTEDLSLQGTGRMKYRKWIDLTVFYCGDLKINGTRKCPVLFAMAVALIPNSLSASCWALYFA